MTPMHVDQLDIDEALVRRLVDDQFPLWTSLPLTRVDSSGTVCALYRLGAELVVRLPLVEGDGDPFALERTWLPRLAPHLPVATAELVATGTPGRGYPCPWAVSRWLPGEILTPGAVRRPDRLALDLAALVRSLRSIDPTGAPPGYRGERLRERDAYVRESIGLMRPGDGVDVGSATAAWDATLAAPDWAGPPVWLHGDLLPGNLLVDEEAHLVGVIDFECAGLGEPACDLMPAWAVLPASARSAFREAVDVDDDTWVRGRGWALSVAIIALPYYRDTNLVMAANARHVINAVIAAVG